MASTKSTKRRSRSKSTSSRKSKRGRSRSSSKKGRRSSSNTRKVSFSTMKCNLSKSKVGAKKYNSCKSKEIKSCLKRARSACGASRQKYGGSKHLNVTKLPASNKTYLVKGRNENDNVNKYILPISNNVKYDYGQQKNDVIVIETSDLNDKDEMIVKQSKVASTKVKKNKD